MFLAGEITSLVLHRDLNLREVADPSGRKGPGTYRSSNPHGRFSGWPVLEDLEGKTPEDEVVSRIRTRFLVARVVQGLVEEEMVVDPDAVRRQVDLVRLEFSGSEGGNPERGAWEQVLQASAAVEVEELTPSVLEWGKMVENDGHLHGARQILQLAFDLARFSGSSRHALEAARALGKNLRTGARWEEALAWYGVAEGIAEDLGDSGRRAVVLDGLANTFRDRGNLPKAREILHEVLEIGRDTGDRYAVAIGHHDLMTVEKLSGDLVSAIRHGWRAVQSYDSREGSLRALFDLSGVLRESGELGAAKDGYSVVANQVAGFEYRVLALDALALIAALEGDGSAYLSIRARMEAAGWRDLSPVYQGQVLYYLGLSCRALGWENEEKMWLGEALSYAETHELNKLIFDVEEALSRAPDTAKDPAPTVGVPEPFGEKISVVRSGLRDLREAEANP
jgi:tetratricopeptide (TPR) repeat protein